MTTRRVDNRGRPKWLRRVCQRVSPARLWWSSLVGCREDACGKLRWLGIGPRRLAIVCIDNFKAEYIGETERTSADTAWRGNPRQGNSLWLLRTRIIRISLSYMHFMRMMRWNFFIEQLKKYCEMFYARKVFWTRTTYYYHLSQNYLLFSPFP